MCATILLAMSALIFTGSLWAVRPERTAIAGKQAAGALYSNLGNAVFGTIYC
jgi:hypothetical protein